MTLVCLSGVKGAPGATTAALLVAASWQPGPVMVDADPAGGDLALRLFTDDGRPLDPTAGLVALAADVRHDSDVSALTPYLQTVAGGLQVMVGFGSSDQAAAIGERWGRLHAALRQHATPQRSELAAPAGVTSDVLVDCGRLSRATPTLPLLNQADLAVLVVRDELTSLTHLRRELRWLLDGGLDAPQRLMVLPIVAATRASSKDTEEAIKQARLPHAVPVLPPIVWSPHDLQMIHGVRRLRRPEQTMLVRSARAAASAMANRISEFATEERPCLTTR